MMYQKILVPLASPDDCEKIFPQALSIAKKEGSILKLLHCINSEVYITPYGTFTSGELNTLLPQWRENLEKEKEKVMKWLTEYSQKASSQGVKTKLNCTIGNPTSTIMNIAKNWEPDLIIMGHRGLTGLSEMFLGSVSNYVVHHAPCSVFLIK